MSSPAISPEQIPEDVRDVCTRLRGAGHEAHVVGGGVRDLILGRNPGDFDIASSALPDVVMDLFEGFAIPTGLQHGTVTVLAGKAVKRHVEVTTFRGEGTYKDGRRPSSVSFGKTLVEDLARRDFTMNAIAYDPIADRLVDPFDGCGDIGRRVIKTVGDPIERFSEDGLRPMRAVRQATQLEFEIDAATLAAIQPTLGSFRMVSAERIRDELGKLLLSRKPSQGIDLLLASGLLAQIIPELMDSVGCTQNRFHKFDVYRHTMEVLDHAPGDLVLRLGALLHDVGKPGSRQEKEDARGEYSFWKHEFLGAEMADGIGRRLKLSTADREGVQALVQHHMFFYTSEWTDGSVRRFVRRIGHERVPALMALREADIIGRGFGEDSGKETRDLRRRIDEVATGDAALTVRELAIDGADVMRVLGLGPGRRIGEVLDGLLERVLDDPGLNTAEKLEALVRAAGQGQTT